MATYKDFDVCCMTCGNISSKPVEVNESPPRKDLPKKVFQKCPKCSNKAYTLDIWSSIVVLSELTKEIVKLKNSVFDLECQIEQLVDPVDYGD